MNIPKLRFKEFTDEWNFLPAEKLFSNINEKNFPNENVLTIIQGKGTVLREQSGRDIIFDENRKNTYKKVQHNDFIIHLRSFEAGLEIANSNGIVSPAYTILRNKIPIASMFYRNYFRSNRFINQILRKAVEGIRDGKQISYSQFKKLPIVYTTFNEQEKIANFLTTVDKKITNLESIITSLENQKKGLLQQIFSQKLRFKDKNGNNYPNWEKKKITDIAITYIGLVTTMTKFYVEKGIPLIRNSDIKENKFIFNEQIFLDENFAKNNSSRQHKLNDIITVHTGDVGTSAIIDEKLVNSIGFATIVTRIKDFNKYNPKYVCWYLNSPICKSKIYTMITGDGRNNLNMKDFNKLYIPIPYLEEQTKIADFLSAFDRKLENQKAQLEHWKQIKKGLLQQMFV